MLRIELPDPTGEKWNKRPASSGLVPTPYGMVSIKAENKKAKIKKKSTKWTKESINEKLRLRNIEMMTDFKRTGDDGDFRCLVPTCKEEWTVRISNVVCDKDPSGCPECNRRSMMLSEEEVRRRLLEKNIELIGEYINSMTLSSFRCLVKPEHKPWITTPGHIFTRDNGCPDCAGNRKWTKEELNKKLADDERDILIVGEYKNNHTNTECHCLNPECNTIWFPCAHSLLQDHGCPDCSSGKLEKHVKELIVNNFVFKEIHKATYKMDDKDRKPDFTIIREDMVNLIIEVNGQQHYEPRTFGGCSKEQAEERFKKQVIRDKQVDEYFKERNIPIVWIKYDMTDEEIIKAIRVVY
jgi:hypothetical protein